MARKTFSKSGESIRIIEVEPDNRFIETVGPDSSDADSTGSTTAESVAGNQPTDFESIGDDEQAPGQVRDAIDPATVAEPKRRGRKPGTKNKPREQKQNIAFVSANLEKVLFSLHTMASAMLKEPELSIDEDEAKLLAEAVAGVARAYDFTAIMSPKNQALIDLTIACGTVYGPRVINVVRRGKKHGPQVVQPMAAVK